MNVSIEGEYKVVESSHISIHPTKLISLFTFQNVIIKCHSTLIQSNIAQINIVISREQYLTLQIEVLCFLWVFIQFIRILFLIWFDGESECNGEESLTQIWLGTAIVWDVNMSVSRSVGSYESRLFDVIRSIDKVKVDRFVLFIYMTIFDGVFCGLLFHYFLLIWKIFFFNIVFICVFVFFNFIKIF